MRVTGPNLRQLREIYDVKLSWDRNPINPETSASARLKQYLDQSANRAAKRAQETPTSGSENNRRPRGRPRALTWGEERKLAIFVEIRRLEGRSVNNAIMDACAVYNVKRATAYRIGGRHMDGAQHMAVVMMRARSKVFRKAVAKGRDFLRPDFSGWSPDQY